jgi:hypothetical protein
MARKELVIAIKAIDMISAPIRRTMTAIGRLGSQAIATTGRVLRGMGGLAKSLINVRNLLGALAVAFAARSLVRAITSVATALDQTAKSARAVGIAVGEYSQLEFAAERSGIAVGQLAKAFITAQRVVAQYVRGEGGAAVRAFKDLDVQLKDSNGRIKTGAALLEAILEPINKIQDEAVKTQKLYDIFGRTGAQFKNIGGDLAALLRDADKYGRITASQTAVAEAFDDALTNQARAWTFFRASVLEAIGPVLTNAINAAAQQTARFGKMVGDLLLTVRAAFGDGKVADQARVALLQVYDNVISVASELIHTGANVLGITALTALRAAIRAIGPIITPEIVGELTGNLAALGKEISFAFKMTGAPKFMQGLADEFQEFTKAVEFFGVRAANSLGDMRGQITGEMNKLRPQVTKEFERLRANLLKLAPDFQHTSELIQTVADSMRRLGVEAKGAGGDVEASVFRMADVLPSIRLGIEKAAESIGPFALQFQQLGTDIYNTVGNQITSGLTAFATGTAKAKDAFRDMAKGILDDLTQLTIRMAVFNALASVFGPKKIPVADLTNAPLGDFQSFGGPGTTLARSGGLIMPGGHIRRFAGGGVVPGPNINRDMVPALLAPGEGVVNRRGMRNLGADNLHAINRGEGGGGFSFTFAPTIHMGGGGSPTSARQATAAMKAAFLTLFNNDPAFRDQVRARLIV